MSTMISSFLGAGHERRVYPVSYKELPDKIVKKIERLLPKIELKRCFSNAMMVAKALRCEYVEGELLIDGSIPIEHAWNAITIDAQKVYFDLTIESYKGRITDEYYAVIEGTPEEIKSQYQWNSPKTCLIQYIQRQIDKRRLSESRKLRNWK